MRLRLCLCVVLVSPLGIAFLRSLDARHPDDVAGLRPAPGDLPPHVRVLARGGAEELAVAAPKAAKPKPRPVRHTRHVATKPQTQLASYAVPAAHVPRSAPAPVVGSGAHHVVQPAPAHRAAPAPHAKPKPSPSPVPKPNPAPNPKPTPAPKPAPPISTPPAPATTPTATPTPTPPPTTTSAPATVPPPAATPTPAASPPVTTPPTPTPPPTPPPPTSTRPTPPPVTMPVETRPGNGYGDKNHDHGGPPGHGK